jgi:hypothetical protein
MGVCPDGMVPQPIGRLAPKGTPGLAALRVNTSTYYFYYAGMLQQSTSYGLQGLLTQHAPRLGKYDYHTLAELATQSSDGAQIVETGWTIDPAINGDTAPHLFVYHWVNKSPTCYNGCGWVQTSKSHYPGMPIEVSSTPQSYTTLYLNGNWWVAYQGEWMGYFP